MNSKQRKQFIKQKIFIAKQLALVTQEILESEKTDKQKLGELKEFCEAMLRFPE